MAGTYTFNIIKNSYNLNENNNPHNSKKIYESVSTNEFYKGFYNYFSLIEDKRKRLAVRSSFVLEIFRFFFSCISLPNLLNNLYSILISYYENNF